MALTVTVPVGIRDAECVKSFHEFTYHFPENFAPYPAHLHIDLKARAQGKGLGSAMIKTLLHALKSKGAAGVHLEMSSVNYRALAFYKKFGFKELLLIPEEECLFLGVEKINL